VAGPILHVVDEFAELPTGQPTLAVGQALVDLPQITGERFPDLVAQIEAVQQRPQG
jgi:hypothetical protein